VTVSARVPVTNGTAIATGEQEMSTTTVSAGRLHALVGAVALAVGGGIGAASAQASDPTLRFALLVALAALVGTQGILTP